MQTKLSDIPFAQTFELFTEVVKYVVEKIATLDDAAKYINYQNEQGNAPLHWAALNGHLEIVKLLVTSHGADMKVMGSGLIVLINKSDTVNVSTFLADQKYRWQITYL